MLKDFIEKFKLLDKEAIYVYKEIVSYYGDFEDKSSECLVDECQTFDNEDIINWFQCPQDYRDDEDDGYILTYSNIAVLLEKLPKEKALNAIIPLYWANCNNYDQYKNSKFCRNWQWHERAKFKKDFRTGEVEIKTGFRIEFENPDLISQLVEELLK